MLGTRATTLTVATIDQYRQWCIARGRSHNTVKAYTTDLTQFLTSAGAVTQEEYEELAQSWLNLYRMKVAPKTTLRRLTSLRGFAKWAGWGNVLEDYIGPTPGKTIPTPIKEGPDGIRRMIEHTKNFEQAAIIALGGFVGCRISETLSLTPSNFNVHDMTLTIRGKGDKTRTVPISHEAWTHIVSPYVLAMQKPDKRLVSYQDRFARQLVVNIGARAKLQRPVSSHDLRATFATAVLDKTGNIRLAQELLGHASVETTEVYTGITRAALKDAVEF